MNERSIEQQGIAAPDGSFEDPIVDSEYTREQAIDSMAEVSQVVESNPERRKNIFERQSIVRVHYLSPEQKIHEGQIIVDKDLAQEVGDLFAFLMEENIAVHSVIPIIKYGGQDEQSMLANNSSGFNYRYIKGTDKLSLHAFGFAIDINPRDNPVQKDGVTIEPPGDDIVRDLDNPNTFTSDHKLVVWLKQRGWTWGGDWVTPYQDYHHFEKAIPTEAYINQMIKSVVPNPEVTAEDMKNRISKLISLSSTKEHLENIQRLLQNVIEHQKISSEMLEELSIQLNKHGDEKI